MLVLVAIVSARMGEQSLLAAHRQATLIERQHTLPALLQNFLLEADASERDCGLAIDSAGRSIEVQGSGVRRILNAGRDSAGRSSLYLQTPPHARQPWVADVQTLRVVAIGSHTQPTQTWPEAAQQAVHTRVTKLQLELGWVDGARQSFTINLVHAPCVRVLP